MQISGQREPPPRCAHVRRCIRLIYAHEETREINEKCNDVTKSKRDSGRDLRYFLICTITCNVQSARFVLRRKKEKKKKECILNERTKGGMGGGGAKYY